MTKKDVPQEIMVINPETIRNKIYFIRGQKVMLDFELAELYGYSTSRFNEQVTNNIENQDLLGQRQYLQLSMMATQNTKDILDIRKSLDKVENQVADVLNSLQLMQDFGVNLICVEDGIDGVASFLNSHGYTKKLRQNNTISGFSSSFVKSVLDNPVYMGKIAYGRRKTGKKIGTRNEMHIVKQSKNNKTIIITYETAAELLMRESIGSSFLCAPGGARF